MSMPMIETSQADASERAARREDAWQAVARRDRGPRRRLRFRCPHHRRLLPAELRLAGGEARERVASTPRRRRRSGRGIAPASAVGPNKLGAADPQVEAVRAACELIAAAEEAPKLADLAARRGHEPVPFPSRVQEVTGVTPKAYAAQTQARRAADELRTADTVTEAIYGAGFNSSSRFYETCDGAPRHDADRGPARRRGRGDPLRDRPGVARRGAGGRDRKGRVRDHARRRSRRSGARASGPFSARRTRSAATRRSSAWSRRSSASSRRRASVSTCRSTSAAPRSRSGSGRRSAPFRPGETATYAEIAEARRRGRRPCAPSLRPAPPIRWRSRSPATGWCGRTATLSGYRWGVERKRELLDREAA